MDRYANRIHIGCNGNLTFEKTIEINRRIKNLFRCDKCKTLINVVTCPSWKDYHSKDRW